MRKIPLAVSLSTRKQSPMLGVARSSARSDSASGGYSHLTPRPHEFDERSPRMRSSSSSLKSDNDGSSLAASTASTLQSTAIS